MGSRARIFVLCGAMAAVGSPCDASEPNAAELARQIDKHIDARLEAEKIRPAAQTDDSEFIRRVHLDLHGRIPSADEVSRFLSDNLPAKRAKLIDTLIDSPRYGEYLADIWQAYLVSPLADDQRLRAERLREWLAGRFNTKTWDRIAFELLTAVGKIEENPAVICFIEGRLPRTVPDLTDLVTRRFLGIRLNCAECHDHPFVDWKQQDFWGMAAFFTQIQTPGKPKLMYQAGLKDYPEVTLAAVQKDSMLDGHLSRPPTFLGGKQPRMDAQTTNRKALAEWMTSPDNPYFARAIVNQTWQRFFGRGIVRQADDMHSANKPSHPELLESLSKAFIESGFDLKFLSRAIALSAAYQRTSRPSDASEKQADLFGRMKVKTLSGAQLYDSFATALGQPAREKNVDPRLGARPEFTQFFAEDGDPDPTSYRRGIPHILRLMNSRQFAGQNLAALAKRLAGRDRLPDDIAADLFLTILSRPPTTKEVQQFRSHQRDSDSAEVAAREWAWALMMTSEFFSEPLIAVLHGTGAKQMDANLRRRDFLTVAAASTPLCGWLGRIAAEAPKGPRPKSCILLWMAGGPSHLDTFDLKPDASAQVRGEFKTIDTSVPGIQISENFPRFAKLMKHAAILRGMSTLESDHKLATYHMHTGYQNRAGAVSFPSMGAIVAKELGKRDVPMPNFVCIGKGPTEAATSGFLGPERQPLMVSDPVRGLDYFEPLSPLPQFERQMKLLRQLEDSFHDDYKSAAGDAHRSAVDRTFRLMSSAQKKAFDLSQEPSAIHEAYGRPMSGAANKPGKDKTAGDSPGSFGQGCLMARRLVEAGVPFIEVMMGGGAGWDTHRDNFPRTRALSTECDIAMSALVEDLQRRELLDSTLIVWMGEFGRSPQITTGGGRNHWARAWSSVLIGGGIKGGQVIGRTDRDAAAVADRPVSVTDFLGTICKILNIDYERKNHPPGVDRPIPIVDVSKGVKLITELL